MTEMHWYSFTRLVPITQSVFGVLYRATPLNIIEYGTPEMEVLEDDVPFEFGDF